MQQTTLACLRTLKHPIKTPRMSSLARVYITSPADDAEPRVDGASQPLLAIELGGHPSMIP